MIPIKQLTNEINLAELFCIPALPVPVDYQAVHSSIFPSFYLALAPETLYFGVLVNGPSQAAGSSRCGEFASGLWLSDVGELFLKSDTSEAYQEFNISPSGQWWSCVFDSHRQPRAKQFANFPNVECLANSTENNWLTALAFPRKDLQIDFGFTPGAKLNLCAILGNPDRRYFSFAKLKDGVLDFHQTASFDRLQSSSNNNAI